LLNYARNKREEYHFPGNQTKYRTEKLTHKSQNSLYKTKWQQKFLQRKGDSLS